MLSRRFALAVPAAVLAVTTVVLLAASDTPVKPAKDAEVQKQLDDMKAAFDKLADDNKKLTDEVSHLSKTSPPIGSVQAFAGDWLPRRVDGTAWTEAQLGCLLCDGRALATDGEYANLFAVIGTSWGDGSAGDGAGPGTKFNLPNLRGLFLRGTGGPAARNPNAAQRLATMPGGNTGDRVGTFQPDAFKAHSHGVNDPGHSHAMGPFDKAGNIYDSGDGRSAWSHFGAPERKTGVEKTGITISEAGGSETQPVNAAVNYVIKFR